MVITGSHPRHLHYANNIINNCEVTGVILQHREEFIPQPSEDLCQEDKDNFVRHFANRSKCEKKFFGLEEKLEHENVHIITGDTLSSKETAEFVREVNPDVVFIFGCGMIRSPLFDALPDLKINMHLGISPRYRGSATLFWPFYFLEPNWAGSTFHIITSEPDAGNIIHQSRPVLERGDTIHDVACKVVQVSAQDVLKIIKILDSGKKLVLHKQKGMGKNFLSRDFIPQHLKVIYNLYDDNIVDHYLDKKIKPKGPKLILVQEKI